jgi:hypothetical protein
MVDQERFKAAGMEVRTNDITPEPVVDSCKMYNFEALKVGTIIRENQVISREQKKAPGDRRRRWPFGQLMVVAQKAAHGVAL